MKNNCLTLSVLLALAGLSACNSSIEASLPPTSVAALKLQPQAWRDRVQATATIWAQEGTIVKSEVKGRVTKVNFRPGAQVAAGALLYEINPAPLAAKLNMVRAEAELESANYQRALQLYAKHVIAKADFDRAQSIAKNHLANVELAEAELEQAQIHAPFAGQTGLDLVKPGDYVNEGQALVSVQQLDHLRLDFSVPEQYSGQIHVGDPVIVQPRDNGQQRYLGVVSAIDNAIDTHTRLLSVRASLDNPQQRLLPGAFVDVTVLYGAESSVIAIPQIAVVNSPDGDMVYRIVAGKALATPVTLGTRFLDRVIVTQGLSAGDVIVTAGQLKIHDGAPVVATTHPPFIKVIKTND